MKRSSFFASLVALLCAVMTQTAAQALELTVHDGTATNSYVPIFGLYYDASIRAQMVYPAGELAGMNGASITAIKWYTTNKDAWAYTSHTIIYLKEVDYTAISAYESTNSCTIVYGGTISRVAGDTTGTVTVTFDTPFTYNGGNLLIGVENTDGGGNWGSMNFYGETVAVASVQSHSGNSPAQKNFLPKTTFTYGVACAHDGGTSLSGYVAATCTAGGYTGDTVCNLCSATLATGYATDPLGHDYSAWVVTLDPEVSQVAAKKLCCTRCHVVDDSATIPDYNEGFEGGTMPAGWTSEEGWTVSTGDYSSTSAHTGSYNALRYKAGGATFDSYKLITPQLDLSGSVAPTLKFWFKNRDWAGDVDQLKVYCRTSMTDPWAAIIWQTGVAHDDWTEVTLALETNYCQLAFEMVHGAGYGVALDDVRIVDTCVPPTLTGLPTENATVTTNGVAVTVGAGGTIAEAATNAVVKVTPADGYQFTAFSAKCATPLSISYELHDSAADGWNGNRLHVVDSDTGVTNATLSIIAPHGTIDRGTIPVTEGQNIRFEWEEGSFAYECSCEIKGVNGQTIMSKAAYGSTIPAPVVYNVTSAVAVTENPDGSRSFTMPEANVAVTYTLTTTAVIANYNDWVQVNSATVGGTGLWYETKSGTANGLCYIFNKAPGTTSGIFSTAKVGSDQVVTTPASPRTDAGFKVKIRASDDPLGTVNVKYYDVSSTGNTVLTGEGAAPTRFFCLVTTLDSYGPGDLDGDGKYTANDTAIINNYILYRALGASTPRFAQFDLSPAAMAAADVDGNGVVDGTDMALIQKGVEDMSVYSGN